MKIFLSSGPVKALAFLMVLGVNPNCLAADTTINTAETTTQGPIMPELNGGDSLTIGPTGSVKVTGNNTSGISGTGSGNTINNYGTVTTSGSVITTGSDASGIRTTGGSTTINNYGTIEATGNGLIPGGNASGINATSGSNTINNYGTINAYGSINARGIRATGDGNTITNSGAITSRNSTAVVGQGSNNNIINTGLIRALGDQDNGILVTGNANNITNTGSIISHSGNSISFSGSGNTLNLGNSSFLAGSIDLGTGTQINITTGANYSKLVNYKGTLSGVSTSGPIPVFVNTSIKQLATYDPTFFAASSDALGDMTNTISSLTHRRFNAEDKEQAVWARGLGMTSKYSGTSATLEHNYIFSGVAIGYDAKLSKDLTVGILGGYGQTILSADSIATQSFKTRSDGGFLGVYGQQRWGNAIVDFALYGGIQNFEQTRYINDSLGYLGNSSANASYQGLWIAPEVGITLKAGELNGWSMMPTARLRYAQQWLGSYTESSGGAANASVNNRNVSIGESFVGIGTRKTLSTTLGRNTKMVLEGQVGYMYRGAVGDDTVNVTLIGQSMLLPTEISSRDAIAVSAGVLIDLSSAVALKIRGDAAAGSGINYVWGGWAGLSVRF